MAWSHQSLFDLRQENYRKKTTETKRNQKKGGKKKRKMSACSGASAGLFPITVILFFNNLFLQPVTEFLSVNVCAFAPRVCICFVSTGG